MNSKTMHPPKEKHRFARLRGRLTVLAILAMSTYVMVLSSVFDSSLDASQPVFLECRGGGQIQVPFHSIMKNRRIMLGMSRASLARRTGLSVHTIARLESGKQQPQYDELYRINNILNLPGAPSTETAYRQE